LLLAALLEYRDTSLRNERDVWAFTKLPTLAVVSYIDDLAHSNVDPKFVESSLLERAQPTEGAPG
jgi:hypothetical protein